nr:oligosaccharide flippase family protein [Amylibacter sp.]
MNNPTPPPAHRPGSLGQRILKAGSWSLILVVGGRGLRLASNLIMTRILVPEAFGLMAMVGILIAGFGHFTDIGINRSIAREPDGDEEHFLHVAWVFKIIRGATIGLGVLLTALALWLLAPAMAPLGSVYADPRLPLLITLSALTPIIMGFESTTYDLAARHLNMKYIALIEVGGQVLQIVAMVAFAALSPTVWALMAGMLTGAALKSASTHFLFSGPRMTWAWNTEIAGRIWHYGKWLMGSSVFSFVAQSADRFVLAALLSTTTFGIYAIAQTWIGAGGMIISRISDSVGFPAVSEMIRTRPNDVPRLYRKFQSVIDVMCILAFLIVLFGGQTLIDLLYTPVYSEAGHYLAILSVIFLTLRFNTLNGLIMNLGHSKTMMIISAIRAVSICILLPLTYHALGLSAALLVIAVNPLITAVYTLSVLRPFLGNKQIRFDMLWLVLTLVVAGCVYVYG